MKIPFQQLDFRWEDSGFYNSTIGRLFFLGSRRHLSLPHTDLVLPTGNTKLHLIVPKGDVHQPPSLIEQRTSNHFQLGPSKCMVPHGSSKTDSGISGCCIYLERGDFSKGMGQVAVFPSYANKRSGSPVLIETLMFISASYRRSRGGSGTNHGKKPALQRWLWVDFVFSCYFLKENQRPKMDEFQPVVICFGSDWRG